MTVYICFKCDSKLIRLSELKVKLKKRTLRELHSLANASQKRSSIDCGICGGPMRLVQRADSAIPLDVCLACEAVWFGGAQSEYERFLLEDLSLQPSVKQMLKDDRVGALARENDMMWSSPPSLNLSPVSSQDRAEDFNFRPVVNGYVFVLVILVSVIAFKRSDFFNACMFSTTQPWPKQVITSITSFFVHAGWWHLIGNMFFFYMFADGVERKSGSKILLGLLLVSQVLNTIIFSILHWGSAASKVGASVGIMALMTYYISADPNRPMRKFTRIPRTFSVIGYSIPAWAFLLVFVLYEFLGIHRQMAGQTRVSHIGHFVGILVGLLFYHFSPPPQKATEAKPTVSGNINY